MNDAEKDAAEVEAILDNMVTLGRRAIAIAERYMPDGSRNLVSVDLSVYKDCHYVHVSGCVKGVDSRCGYDGDGVGRNRGLFGAILDLAAKLEQVRS